MEFRVQSLSNVKSYALKLQDQTQLNQAETMGTCRGIDMRYILHIAMSSFLPVLLFDIFLRERERGRSSPHTLLRILWRGLGV